MAMRDVYKTGKDRDGDITSLCDDGASWSPRAKARAIEDIDSGTHSYWSNGKTRIVVRERNGKKYLTTGANATTADNLDNLPDC